MNKYEYTGERFVPEYKAQSIMALEHYHRYMFCSKYVNNKKVLDIACGTGYGAELMSYAANKVTGADIDPVTIQYCNALYKKKIYNLMLCLLIKLTIPKKVLI